MTSMSEPNGAKVGARTTRSKTPASPKPKAPKQAVPKPPKPMPPAKRKTLATEQLLTTLAGSDRGAAISTAAITAALEVANEWLAIDATFQHRILEKYNELMALGNAKQKADPGPMPKPIRAPGTAYSYNPLAMADPWHLALDYGNDQLPAVLAHVSQDTLREMVHVVQSRYPGTKPNNASNNASMIDYIVEHVTSASR